MYDIYFVLQIIVSNSNLPITSLSANFTKWSNILKQFVDELFECVWPFRGVGAWRVNTWINKCHLQNKVELPRCSHLEMAASDSGNSTVGGNNTLSGLPDNAKTDSACGGVITDRRITSIPWMKKRSHTKASSEKSETPKILLLKEYIFWVTGTDKKYYPLLK